MSQLIDQIINADSKELQNFANFEVIYAESKFEGTKAAKLFGSYAVVEQLQRAIERGNREEIFASLEATPGYQDPQQFEEYEATENIHRTQVGEGHDNRHVTELRRGVLANVNASIAGQELQLEKAGSEIGDDIVEDG